MVRASVSHDGLDYYLHCVFSAVVCDRMADIARCPSASKSLARKLSIWRPDPTSWLV